MMRISLLLALALCGASPVASETRALATLSDAGLRNWIDGFRDDAIAAGISASVFDREMAGLTFAEKVVERDRNQSEFTLSLIHI